MFLRVNNLNMFVDVRGSATNETILFIHGFPFDHSMWRHQMQAFSGAFRCIAPDLRGHGGTIQVDKAAGVHDVSMDRYADDLMALLDQPGGQHKVTVCGLSLGGYIAFALWRKYPDRIQRLILSDTKATPDNDAARSKRSAQAMQVSKDGVSSISNGMLDTLLHPDHRAGILRMEVRRMIESTAAQGVIDTLGALANRPDSTPTLATINVPTLLLVGDNDTTTPLSDAQWMQQHLAGSGPVTIISNAGHLSPLENPDQFNLTLSAFLKST
jgi:pimeloyl-ACP methyl ester carboxylesterase